MKIKQENLSKRIKLSMAQKDFLSLCFDLNPNPSAEERTYISRQTAVPEDKVRNWFQNRRAKEKGNADFTPCLSFSDIDSPVSHAPKVHPTSNDLYIRR